MARQSEPNVNNALGELLRTMLPRSAVRYENTRTLAGNLRKQPDILITAPGRSPVVIESEYMSSTNVEPEAKARLGLEVVEDGRIIEAVIALHYPDEIGDAYDFRAALTSARLSYCLFTEGEPDAVRFPDSGWLEGSVEDLADMVRLVSVPQRAVAEAATTLQEGITRAAKLLDEVAKLQPSTTISIARLLGMSNVRQARRMASAIIANALVFHERIAGMHPGVKPLAMVCGDGVANPKAAALDAWDTILGINYWAIFAIARDILTQLPTSYAVDILRRLRDTAQAVEAAGVDNAHDLTGRVFQTLIADRKYLATFYTLPASAALLARLAVAKLESVDWSTREAIGKLRIGDFACGTGALLSAVYEQIAARHERAGGDPAALHTTIMEEVLYGCDVMPSAVHITGSTLAGVEPSVLFNRSRLYTLAYGRQDDRGVKIGSLELLQSSAALALFNTSEPAKRTGSTGEETAAQILADVPDKGYDLVIMNPPFTRATNHEGAHADITNPAFAAFDATRADQTAMGDRINRLGDGTCYHGNAGIASAFVALAHRKLKLGGVLALVLPLSAASGQSWEGVRKMLAEHYIDLSVLTLAGADNDALSFSADTGMAECLVIARKRNLGESSQGRAQFTSLHHRPRGFVHAGSLASRLLNSNPVRRIEDGPYAGTPLTVGEEPAGETMTAPCGSDNWSAVRLSDHSLAQTAFSLSHSKLWLPGSPSPVDFLTAPLGDIGQLGLVHRDITGPAPRGPFDTASPSSTATYPALWNHDAKQETRMVCKPDSQLLVRPEMEEKAAQVWTTASRAHVTLDFRFNSQPLASAFTERATIGGRAWPNVILHDKRYDYAFTVWSNSTLGLLCFWWHSNRQHSGRGTTTIRAVPSLPVLDFRTLNAMQLRKAEEIFKAFRNKELEPAYLADADPNRALLDHRILCDLLGFDEDTYVAVRRLAAKWCAEPSVHGGKARPKNATLVI